jgi:hypothetical protein
MTDTNVKCVNYIEDINCEVEDGQNAFYMSTITQPLSYIVIVIFGIILFMIGLQILSTFIFYIWFQILMVNNFIIESDEINVKKLKMHEMYYYKLFNYIFCFDDQSNTEKHVKHQNFYDFFDFTTSNSCYEKEPYAKITLINNFYNFQFQLMMYAITATLIAAIVSGFMSFLNINGYVIVGSSITSFIKEYIWMVISFFIIAFFIVLNSLIYKYYFIDSVVANIFTGYNEMLKLDKYVFDRLEETKADIKLPDNLFLSLLQQLQKDDFNNETILSVISQPFVEAKQSSNERIANIILNIRRETDNNKKAAKIFMYTIYIYFHNQNAENDNILTIIDDILTQKNKDNIYTFRSLLPLEIDEKNVIFDINSIVQLLGSGIFTTNLDGTSGTTSTTPEQQLTTLTTEKEQATTSATTARKILAYANTAGTTKLDKDNKDKLKLILPLSKDAKPDTITIDRKYEVVLNRDDKLDILLKIDENTVLSNEALVIKTTPVETKYTYKDLLTELKDYKESLEKAKNTEYDLEAKVSCRDDINAFRLFDFVSLAPDSYQVVGLKQSLASRLKTFHTILMSISDIKGTLKVEKIGKDLNLVLVLIWIIPSFMLLAVLYMIKTIAQDNERLKKAINFIVELILAAFDEFFWGVVF